MPRWLLISLTALILATAIFCIGLYTGKIGYSAMEWNDFRDQFMAGRFHEVQIAGRTVTAIYVEPNHGHERITVIAPADPIPENDMKWLMFKSREYNVRLVFKNKTDSK